MKSESQSYKDAGVDITAGYEAVKLIKQHIAKTVIPGVMGEVGGFGGLFMPNLSNIKEPVLVSGTDGVGTKLKLAFIMNRHNTIGIDCVAMCVNDIICAGASPMFFLDYLALGKNVPAQVEQIVAGIASGCQQAGCALIGGETAEMPGFYPVGEYDLAGFSVGMVDRGKLIDGSRIMPGDVVVALPSSGVHSNGFSLLRKVFQITDQQSLNKYQEELGHSLGEELLTPTKIYVKPLLALMEKTEVRGVVHVTGGGFYENFPRILPEGTSLKIDRQALQTPPIFPLIQKVGNISEKDMFNTFNMGVGMGLVMAANQARTAVDFLHSLGEEAYVLGEIISGNGEVIL